MGSYSLMTVSSSPRSMCFQISFSWFTFKILVSLTIKIPAQGNLVVHPCSVCPHQQNQKSAPKLISIISLSGHIIPKFLYFLLLYKAERFLWSPTEILSQDSMSYCLCCQLSLAFSAPDTLLRKHCSCTGMSKAESELQKHCHQEKWLEEIKGIMVWLPVYCWLSRGSLACKRKRNVEAPEMLSYCKIIFTRIKWCIKT